MNQVIVLDYDPRWPGLFDELRAFVWPVVADVATAVEHVGSTAVPGLAAKPVIDMDVIVKEESDQAAAIARLETLGYVHRGDLGVPGREAFQPPGHLPAHHLYLCLTESPALANHLAIRDYLRGNPPAAEEYGELKRRLAREFPNDIDGYVEGKTAFLVDVLRRVGMSDDELSEIDRINRRP